MKPDQLIAGNRFGLGLRADGPVAGDAKSWLRGQFKGFDPKATAFAALVSRSVIATELADYLEQVRDTRQDARAMGEDPKAAAGDGFEKELRRYIAKAGKDYYATAATARFNAALTTTAPFVERLVHFWANHFAVSADKLPVIGLSPYLEIEAIRPHVLGRFADMLLAVEQHPAMLLYLDQAQSIGPNSPLGARAAARGGRKVGLNENLAREILELHTLGVRTGYAQEDVTELARALTGWTVSGITRGPIVRLIGLDKNPGDFAFAGAVHEPGTRHVMGKNYAQAGEAQARAILLDLARHPATARHIATKLARHFAGDDPPASLITRLEQSFLSSGGDLAKLYTVLIDAPEIWQARSPKFKTPWDWAVSAYRAVGLNQIEGLAVVPLMKQLGQPVWQPKSPAGYDDIAASWAGPDALFRRVEVAERLSARAGSGVDPRRLATAILPVGETTVQAIARAESPAQGLALMLVSPEFMRR